MLNISREQPPDWMQFSAVAQVQWTDIDAMVERTYAEIAVECSLLVAILRAGSPIATLLARKTGLPLDYLLCSRMHPRPVFVNGVGQVPCGRDILLIDDVCGSGWTFERAKAYCESLGNRVKTYSIYRCDAPDMYIPDYSMPMEHGIYLRWPWEYQREVEMPEELQSNMA